MVTYTSRLRRGVSNTNSANTNSASINSASINSASINSASINSASINSAQGRPANGRAIPGHSVGGKRRVYSSMLSRFGYLPLVWGCLRAYLEEEPDLLEQFSLEQPFFLPEQIPGLVDSLVDPAVFMVSCYLWNFRRQMALCRDVKERFPDVVTVAGGPHVPDDPTDFFAEHPYVDFAIHKEGEKPFAGLLRALASGNGEFSQVPSLSWRDSAVAVHRNPLGGQLPRELATASPWLSGLMTPSIELVRQHDYHLVALWETNRGCPYSCTFCDWGSSTMSKLRRYEDERLHAEIDFFAGEQVHGILCCDANFGILPRDKELADHFAAARESRGFPRRFATSYAKNATNRVFEIGRILAGAGLTDRAVLAIQSGSAEVLEHVRRSNMKAERYEELAASFHGAGIDAHTEVILGLPQETRQTFADGLSHMLEIGLHDHISIYECVLLPNSEMSGPVSRERYALDTIHRPYLFGDMEQVELVVGTSSMTRSDWCYMYLFGSTIQALHNQGLTDALARYLHREGILPYQRFYRSLLDRALETGDGVFAEPLIRARQLLQDYLVDDTIPNEGKVLSQPDMAGWLAGLLPGKTNWLIYEWCWAHVQSDLDRFYNDLHLHIIGEGVELDARLEDLFRYQRAKVFTLADSGARMTLFDYDWPRYLQQDEELVRVPTPLRFEPPRERMR
jgi:putative methyltransferase